MAQPFDPSSLKLHGEAYLVAPDVPLYAAEFVGTGRGHFSVSKDGVIVYITQPNPLLQTLTWFDRTGKELGTIGAPALYFGPRIAPDGRRVAVAHLDPRTRYGDIYVLDENGGTMRLTFDPAKDIQPVWAPGGDHVIWASHRNGKSQLYRKRADGSGGEELLHESTYSLASDDVSADGKLLVFRESHPDTQNDLWVLPLDGSGVARPIMQSRDDEPRARFSPDGTLLGYISSVSGPMTSFLVTFPALDSQWEVATGGSTPAQWRRDSKEIYYGSTSAASPAVFARSVLSTMPLRLGEPVRLFTLPLTPRGSFFHVTGDGQRFLFAVEPVQTEPPRYHLAIDWMRPQ